MTSLSILLAAAASAGFIHTLLGPDHYIPFIVMSKARNWSLRQTLFTTLYCGVGHVASSIIIGFAGIALGYGISQIEGVEMIRGSLAGWAFFVFGFAYMVWGIFKAVKNKPHTHLHSHGGGELHVHEHTHHTDHAHAHTKSAKMLTPWVLFIIFVLGPCEILIPLVMIPAANHDTKGIVAVSLLFSTITILTMCAAVTIGYYGFKVLPTAKIDRYMHAIAGATICLSGFAILFLDL
jgi:ABC-type nickel/cobalt efflux system permease component RcnA